MEKDLKDKKPAENGTSKVPWTKMIPAAAVIAALAFSGIKAKGSEESTEAVQKEKQYIKEKLIKEKCEKNSSKKKFWYENGFRISKKQCRCGRTGFYPDPRSGSSGQWL